MRSAMATEPKVREALISAFRHIREQHATLRSLIVEVSAIRESLIEIGPKYQPIVDKYRNQHQEESSWSASEDLRKLDAIIDQLRFLP